MVLPIFSMLCIYGIGLKSLEFSPGDMTLVLSPAQFSLDLTKCTGHCRACEKGWEAAGMGYAA